MPNWASWLWGTLPDAKSNPKSPSSNASAPPILIWPSPKASTAKCKRAEREQQSSYKVEFKEHPVGGNLRLRDFYVKFLGFNEKICGFYMKFSSSYMNIVRLHEE